MLVAHSFDLWQKDTFFSAAEEVQQSADIMESAYRTWLRAKRESLISQHLDDLERELRMAFGTAKWQLEEFEKAVSSSYRNRSDDVTGARHKQFVSVIEDQISRVETSLKESSNAEGKKPFRWVNLDAEECDDFARFLSGSSKTIRSEDLKPGALVTSSVDSEVTPTTQTSTQENSLEQTVCNEDASCQADRITSNRRTWNSPDRLEIVIDSGDVQKKVLSEETPKLKGTKPTFWRSRHEENAQTKIISWMSEQLRGNRRILRQQGSVVLPKMSMRYILVLMITMFLVVPFIFISN